MIKRGHLHNRLEPQSLDVVKVMRLGEAASIDTRNDDTKVVRSAIERRRWVLGILRLVSRHG